LFFIGIGLGCTAPQPAPSPEAAPRSERSERKEERREQRREENREERQANSSQTPGPTTQAASGTIRDLEQDEAAGGHTLKKHVGRTDDQLRERLERERNISAASTWTDLSTAEQAVGAAIAQDQDRINRWLDRSGSRPNLVLDYDGDPAHPIGRSMRRGQDQSQPCSHALVVLKWAGDRNYYVLTTYPECRS
jgi:toxin YxiD